MARFVEMVESFAIAADQRKSHYGFAKYLRHIDGCNGGGDQSCECGMAQIYFNLDQILDDAEAAHHVLRGSSIDEAYKKVGERLMSEARDAVRVSASEGK